jgi:hypothetical protein
MRRRRAPKAPFDPEFMRLIAGLWLSYEEGMRRCGEVATVGGRIDEGLSRRALEKACEIASLSRVLWEAIINLDLIDRVPPECDPMRALAASARLAYSLTASAQAEPEPETILTIGELHRLPTQYALGGWLEWQRERFSEAWRSSEVPREAPDPGDPPPELAPKLAFLTELASEVRREAFDPWDLAPELNPEPAFLTERQAAAAAVHLERDRELYPELLERYRAERPSAELSELALEAAGELATVLQSLRSTESGSDVLNEVSDPPLPPLIVLDQLQFSYLLLTDGASEEQRQALLRGKELDWFLGDLSPRRPEPLGQVWRSARAEAAKKKQVVEAVHAAGRDKTRPERRALFEAERVRLGASPDPSG